VDLPEHEDGSPWSFVLPLNAPHNYDGGGTQFVDLEGAPTLCPPQGTALLFSGRNRHRGVAITRGVRYILAGFCAFPED
jgi:predicted 2-oxoglutarate/Fe(II)-dependent dioxygenase YbiX